MMHKQLPECFVTGILPSNEGMTERQYKMMLTARALCAWSGLMAGFVKEVPEKFGETMAKIGGILGCVSTGEGLMKYSQENRFAEPLPPGVEP
jgi:hypothetical protein